MKGPCSKVRQHNVVPCTCKHMYDSLKGKLTASDDESSSSKTSPQLQTYSVH